MRLDFIRKKLTNLKTFLQLPLGPGGLFKVIKLKNSRKRLPPTVFVVYSAGFH